MNCQQNCGTAVSSSPLEPPHSNEKAISPLPSVDGDDATIDNSSETDTTSGGANPPTTKDNKTPLRKKGLKFAIIGDWGTISKKKSRVAALYNERTCASSNTDFTLSVGDNFYPLGVFSVYDPQFKFKWTSVYKTENPWYIVAGNHDWNLSISAQINYSKMNPKWNMPAPYYEKTFYFDPAGEVCTGHDAAPPSDDQNSPNSSKVAAHFLFIDTEILATQRNGDETQRKHLTWLEERLKESSSHHWIFVVGHVPVFSVGSHGPNPFLIESVKPLFERYHVNAYLSGHDHLNQYFSLNDVAYISSGDGGQSDSKKTVTRHIGNPNNPPNIWHNAEDIGAIVLFQIHNAEKATFAYNFADGTVCEFPLHNTRTGGSENEKR